MYVCIKTWPFHHPVSAKKIPDYHKIIKMPMDLHSMQKVMQLIILYGLKHFTLSTCIPWCIISLGI